MKKIFVMFFLIVSFLFLNSGLLVAYSPGRPRILRPGGERLRPWFKRDLAPYDLRYQIVAILRELRAFIARSEALGLTPVQKSSLIGLTKKLEQEMTKTLKEIRQKSKLLDQELHREDPSQEKCLALAREIASLWAELYQKALKTYFRAQEMFAR